uniref:Uncharacterized protein n=1 Tax=Mycena chlorophos TaxID=658473 RepID=A0ABQ0L965_MYCCL|nr:predicted protein [Mycena chlorophos]
MHLSRDEPGVGLASIAGQLGGNHSRAVSVITCNDSRAPGTLDNLSLPAEQHTQRDIIRRRQTEQKRRTESPTANAPTRRVRRTCVAARERVPEGVGDPLLGTWSSTEQVLILEFLESRDIRIVRRAYNSGGNRRCAREKCVPPSFHLDHQQWSSMELVDEARSGVTLLEKGRCVVMQSAYLSNWSGTAPPPSLRPRSIAVSTIILPLCPDQYLVVFGRRNALRSYSNPLHLLHVASDAYVVDGMIEGLLLSKDDAVVDRGVDVVSCQVTASHGELKVLDIILRVVARLLSCRAGSLSQSYMSLRTFRKGGKFAKRELSIGTVSTFLYPYIWSTRKCYGRNATCALNPDGAPSTFY